MLVLPHQALQGYGRVIMRAAVGALASDNEGNAVFALRVVDWLHKGRRNMRPLEAGTGAPGKEDPSRLDDFIAPYLHFVQSVTLAFDILVFNFLAYGILACGFIVCCFMVFFNILASKVVVRSTPSFPKSS